jgi:hypothetical protein
MERVRFMESTPDGPVPNESLLQEASTPSKTPSRRQRLARHSFGAQASVEVSFFSYYPFAVQPDPTAVCHKDDTKISPKIERSRLPTMESEASHVRQSKDQVRGLSRQPGFGRDRDTRRCGDSTGRETTTTPTPC